jgi:hypothetical protein
MANVFCWKKRMESIKEPLKNEVPYVIKNTS